MIDVIAFLLENFRDFDACPPNEDLCGLLEQEGFHNDDINDMLLFLDILQERNRMEQKHFSHASSMRIYLPEERDAVPCEALGLLHFLEQNGALLPEQREFVLMALLHLSHEHVLTLQHAKVLALLVLWADKSELPILIGDDLMAAVLQDKVLIN
ncbi:MAG: DUF494 domain-containing protein [Eikenella sp.]|nr:DUF494 domain-containing protein [Eikenella sp.]